MRLKRLELWWRSLWIEILVRLMRRSGGGRPAWGSRAHRVLFLRHDRAGDMILSTGVMRAIARSHPTIHMDVLASPANAAILEASDFVQQVILFDKKSLASYAPTFARLRRQRYDAVIDCMVTAPSVTTLLLIFASGAQYRIGIAGRGNDAAFNVTVPATSRANPHMVDLLAALAPAFDVDAAEVERPIIALREDERSRAEETWGPRAGPRVLVNVSAGTPARRWPVERYAAVMSHLRDKAPGVHLLVIGAPGERERAEAIARAGGGRYVRTPGMRDAFALVATADFLLSPDTSISHAASAFRVPSVVMLVAGTRERWGLYDTPGESIEHGERTLDTLPLEPVLAAVDRVWSSAVVSRRG